MIGGTSKLGRVIVREVGVEGPEHLGTLYFRSRMVSFGGDQGVLPISNHHQFLLDLLMRSVAFMFLIL